MDLVVVVVTVGVVLLTFILWKYHTRRTKKVISDEELNFWKLYLLCSRLATESVRIFLDRQIPKSSLESHLNKWRTQLDPSSRSKFKCFPDQFNILFPAPPDKVSSLKFDFSLLYKLIRNTLPNSHTYTWGQQLANLGFTDLDDIERIRHYRNELAHSTKLAISNRDFQNKWSCLSGAVTRLSNKTLLFDVQELEEQTLDIRTSNEALEDMKRDLEFVREEVNALQQDVYDHEIKLQGHETHLRDHDKKFLVQEKKLSNPIPENVEQQTEKILENWKIDDKVFCFETRAYTAVINTVESAKITAIIGGPGAGKSATAHHIALEYETKGWQVIPVTSLEHVVEYGNPSAKQVFVIDDLFGVYTPEMSVYNTFRKCREKLEKGQGRDFKILLTSRKSVFYEAIGNNPGISIVEIDNKDKHVVLNNMEKKKILRNHCKEKGLGKEVYEHLNPTTEFMFPFLCSQFVSNSNYQRNGERFFNHPHECILDELDRLQELNQNHYAVLVLCLLSNNELETMHEVSMELKSDVINRCCDTSGITDRALANALSHLTGIYIAQTGDKFKFIHDSLQEIVGYHFGKDNIDLILKYMYSSFVWGKITLSKEMKNEDLCIEIGEKYYQLLAERMYADIKDDVMSQLFDVFRNKSISRIPFIEIFFKVIEGSENDPVPVFLQKWKFVEISYTDNKPDTFFPSHYMQSIRPPILFTWYSNSQYDYSVYRINILSLILYFGHTNILKCVFRNLDERNISKSKWLSENFHQGNLAVLACYSGNTELVKILFRYIDKSVYSNNISPIIVACTIGKLELVRYLESLIRINEKEYPLLMACRFGHLHVVKYIAQKRRDEHHYNISLFEACSKGYIDIVRYFLDLGVDVNIRDINSETPLYIASTHCYIEMIHFLGSRGADFNIRTLRCETPISNALLLNKPDILNILIKAENDRNTKEKHGNIRLFNTIVTLRQASIKFDKNYHGYTQIDCNSDDEMITVCDDSGFNTALKQLLKVGFDINSCIENGDSPLLNLCNYYMYHLSLYSNGNEDFIIAFQWFVKNGADIYYRNNKNENARDRVKRWKDMNKLDSSDFSVDLLDNTSIYLLTYACSLDPPYFRTALEFVELWNCVDKDSKRGINEIKQCFRRNSI